MGTIKTTEELFDSPKEQKKVFSTEELFNSPKTSRIAEFGQGVSKGLSDFVGGLKQRDIEARRAIGAEPEHARPYFEAEMKGLRESYKKRQETTPKTLSSKIGEIAGPTLLTLPIPIAKGGLLARSLASGITGAGLGLTQPTTESDSVASNVLAGGVTGAVTPGLLAPVGKVMNAAKGVVGKGAQELLALSKKYKIPLTLGELSGNPIIQKAETWLEAIPVLGIKGFRIKQNVKADDASKKFLSSYVKDQNAPDIMEANRNYVSGLFEDLKKMVSSVEKDKIVPNETRNTASSLLGRYPDIFKKFQDVKREGIIKNIVEGVKPNQLRYWQEGEGKLREVVSEKALPSFEDMWTLRDGIGEMIGQARRKLVSGDVDKTTIKQLSVLYRAVNGDIDNWTKSIGKPEIKEAIHAANSAYKQYVVKYRAIQDAVDRAEGKVGAGEMFSPKKLSTALKSIVHKQQLGEGKLFSTEEITHMEGLYNIMQAAKRAEQFMDNPPTGNRWGIAQMVGIGMGIPGGLAMGGEPGYAATMLGTELSMAGIGKFLTTTEIGKRLCLAASNIQPNSPEMLKILYNVIPKATAIGAAKIQAQSRKENDEQ